MRYSWMMILGLLCAALPAQAETLDIDLKIPEIHGLALKGEAGIVSLWVEDNRAAPALGRELHGKSVMPRQDVAILLRNALAGSLRTAGFRVEEVHTDKSIDLVVHITSLSYKAEDGFVTSKAILSSRVTAEVGHGDWHVNRSLGTTAEHTVPLSPNAEKIAELVNETLSDTLRIILEDEQIGAALKDKPQLSN